MKKNGSSLFSTICFVLFIIWGIGTLLSLVFGLVGINIGANAAAFVDKILRIASIIVMVYSAYLFYCNHKSSKPVYILFWISLVVAIAVIVLFFI